MPSPFETAPGCHSRTANRKKRWILAAGIVAAGMAGAVLFSRTGPVSPAPVLRTLTGFPGSELHPQVSPDGERVVFCWNGPSRNNFDVYVMPYRGGEPKRLTNSPSRDVYAAWSPDGKTIAFARNPGPRGSIYLIPSGGGQEQKLADAEAFTLVYSPDGKKLVFTDRASDRECWHIAGIDLATGARQRLTDPPEDTLGDADPAFSPDGKWLAFARHGHGSAAEVFVQPASGGESVRLTNDHHRVFGISWMPNSREIIFSSDRKGNRSLWKLSLNVPWTGGLPQLQGEPVRVPGAGENALHPSCAGIRSGRATIAYQRLREDFNLWLEDIDGPAHPHVVASSAARDMTPSFAPDGRSIAFASERSGVMQIWTSDLGGGNARQLTNDTGKDSRAPQWSHDGQWIAYDSSTEGGTGDLFIMPSHGGPSRRLTTEPSDDRRPFWSADDRWIYYRSDRDGSDQIWKLPVSGGEPVTVTLHGGRDAAESADGRTLFICRSDGLYARTAGKPDTRILLFPCEGRWSVSKRGILYYDGAFHVRRFDGRPGLDIDVPLKLDLSEMAPLAVSLDGRQMMWSNLDSRNSDTILLEGVR